MMRRKKVSIDPVARAIASGRFDEIGAAYERMREASEFGLPEGLTLPGYEDDDPPMGRYHGARGGEIIERGYN